MLAAADTIGAIPDYHFQAVGSAAGALGVREAAHRLIGDGRFGRHVPQLMLAQNAPFTPLFDAWSIGAPVLLERSVADAMMLFAETEGIDIDPEAGIATAALVRAVADGSVERNRRVLLNVTGGGRVLDCADAARIGNEAVLFSSRL